MQSTSLQYARPRAFRVLGTRCTRSLRVHINRGPFPPCCTSGSEQGPLSDMSNSLTGVQESAASSLDNAASSAAAKSAEAQKAAKEFISNQQQQNGQSSPGSNQVGETEQGPMSMQDDVADVVTRSVSEQGMQEAEAGVATDSNVLSVGFGDRVVLLDKAKVTALGRNAAIVFFGVTFTIAIFNTVRKYLAPEANRKRTVNKNRELVEELMKYLPGNREALTSNVIWVLRVKTGYTTTEIFRKYLWFLLRERQFDQEAVDDLVHLKNSMDMGDEEVSAALRERAQRIYDKYGTLMLNTEGLTGAGVERKATCKALFSKLLYLVNYEPLLNPESEGYSQADLRQIFGATERDCEKLRIVTLQEVDMDALDKLATVEGTGDVKPGVEE